MGKARFNHYRKFEQNYNPYGSVFTERQERIIRGMDPGEVRKTELTILLKKAERMGCDDLVLQLAETYESVMYPDEVPYYSVKEAIAIMEALSPWPIHWEISTVKSHANTVT